VGELESEYAGRLEFNIIPAEVTAQSQADIDAFGFTEALHGLVVFDAAGEPAVKMPGHQFGKEEIVVGIEAVLAKQ